MHVAFELTGYMGMPFLEMNRPRSYRELAVAEKLKVKSAVTVAGVA